MGETRDIAGSMLFLFMRTVMIRQHPTLTGTRVTSTFNARVCHARACIIMPCALVGRRS